MKEMNISVAQLSPKLGDKAFNYEQIVKAVKQAKREKSNMVVFPELFLTGYSVGEDVEELAETVDGEYMSKIRQLCKDENIYMAMSFPEDGGDGNYYISSALINDTGDVLGVYRKVHLFDAETQYFKAGSDFEVIDTPFGKIGMMICFDVEFPEIARSLKLMGADIIIIVNANMHPYETHHHIFARSRAMENEVPVVICNRLGLEGELDFCGDSMVIGSMGELYLSLKDKETVETVCVPLDGSVDPKMNYTKSRRASLYGVLAR